MKIEDYQKAVREYFEEKEIPLSESTIEALSSRTYLDHGKLEDMSDSRVRQNLDVLLEDVVQEYEGRTAKARRPTKVRDIDTRPVLRRRFCQLPPFCK
jgi:hypothetical protein